jgi:hypothetical protein
LTGPAYSYGPKGARWIAKRTSQKHKDPILDDLMLIPVGMAAAIKMIPVHVWEDCKARSRASLYSKLPHSKAAVIVIVILWITAIAWFGGLVWPFFDEQRY